MASEVTFTGVQRAMSVTDALRDNELRPRVLHYVAARRGISTGDALAFIEGPLYRQLGVIPGSADNPTLGQLLGHLDNPHLDGPAPGGKGGTMSTLDMTCRQAFADHHLLNQIVSAIELDQNVDFMVALERVHQGVEAVGAGAPLGRALDRMGMTPADVAETVRLMVRRDEAVTRELEAALGPAVMLESTNREGKVLLDRSGIGPGVAPPPLVANGRQALPGGGGGVPLQADIGKVLGDPAEFERRLARARKATGAFTGDQGRDEFKDVDRQHAEAGIDYVRTMERPRELRAAQGKAAQVGRQLDQAIRESVGQRQRARALDVEIARLSGERARLASTPLPGGGEPRVMLLDRDSDPPGWSEEARAIEARIRAQGVRGRDAWLRALDQDPSRDEVDVTAHTKVFLRVLHDDAFVDEPRPGGQSAPEPAPDASSRMHQRVTERLRLLDRGDSEYVRTFEELMVEDAVGVRKDATGLKMLAQALLEGPALSGAARSLLGRLRPGVTSRAELLAKLNAGPSHGEDREVWRELEDWVRTASESRVDGG